MGKRYMKSKIAIIGLGMVGGTLAKVLDNPVLYDPPKGIGSIDEVNECDIVFICVPTPGEGDISAVEESISILKPKVVRDIAPESYEDLKIPQAKIVVIKSTILPGTTDYFQDKYPQHKFLFNPEFLTETTAKEDMARPDTQLIGYTDKSYNVATDILSILPKAPFERIIPVKEAEMTKFFRNTWYATKVIFANQIYDLCQEKGIDYDIVKDCVSADRMMTGTSHLDIFHKGYRGFSGKCLPKDLNALLRFAKDNSVEVPLLEVVKKINEKWKTQQQ